MHGKWFQRRGCLKFVKFKIKFNLKSRNKIRIIWAILGVLNIGRKQSLSFLGPAVSEEMRKVKKKINFNLNSRNRIRIVWAIFGVLIGGNLHAKFWLLDPAVSEKKMYRRQTAHDDSPSDLRS